MLCLCVNREGAASQVEAYTSWTAEEEEEEGDEVEVVPLLRHQGEMDSCGKDASGNTSALQMSFKTSGNLLEVHMMRNKPYYFILRIFLCPIMEQPHTPSIICCTS